MSDMLVHIKSWLSKAFNLPLLQKNRMTWVDYLRGIAIILVIYRHGLIGIERSGIPIPAYLSEANMIFYSFRMPLFFIISGIFIGKSLEKKSFGKLLFIKFETLLYPYFVWAFIQVTLQILLRRYVNSDRSWHDYTYILYQPRVLDQFWYLPALFNTTLVYMLIKVKLKAKIWMQLLLGIILYFVSGYIKDISMLSDWMEFYFFFALGDAISSYFFKGTATRFFNKNWLLLSIIPIFVLTQLFYLSQKETYYRESQLGQVEFLIIALIGCLSMFILAFKLQAWKIMKWLRVIGFHSLYIYMMHVLVIAFIRIFLTNILGIHESGIILSCGIFFGITFPIIFYNFFIRESYGWFLFSLRKPKPAITKDDRIEQVNRQQKGDE